MDLKETRKQTAKNAAAPPVPGRNDDRFRALWLFTLLSLIQTPFFVFFYWKAGSPAASLVVVAAVLPIALTYWIARKFNSPVLAGNWIVATGFIIFGISATYTGGIAAPALTWSIAVPIVATLICGARSGIVWAILVAVKFSFFFWYEYAGGQFVQQYTPGGYQAAYYVTMLGIALFSLMLALISESLRDRYEKRIEKSNRELREALEKIKTLKGLLPICAWCKKVRNDKGYWDQVEVYLKDRSELEFSHGICPECDAKSRREWQH